MKPQEWSIRETDGRIELVHGHLAIVLASVPASDPTEAGKIRREMEQQTAGLYVTRIPPDVLTDYFLRAARHTAEAPKPKKKPARKPKARTATGPTARKAPAPIQPKAKTQPTPKPEPEIHRTMALDVCTRKLGAVKLAAVINRDTNQTIARAKLNNMKELPRLRLVLFMRIGARDEWPKDEVQKLFYAAVEHVNKWPDQ